VRENNKRSIPVKAIIPFFAVWQNGKPWPFRLLAQKSSSKNHQRLRSLGDFIRYRMG